MLSPVMVSILSALAIGCVIGGMAMIRDVKYKALLYSLPFPITIALIAVNRHINSSHILGLMLIGVFMVTVQWLHDRKRTNTVVADILAALLYIIGGYSLIWYVKPPFWPTFATGIALWLLALWWYRTHPAQTQTQHRSVLATAVKGSGAAIVVLACCGSAACCPALS